MKNYFLIIAFTFCITSYAQKLKVDEVDEFTEQRVLETEWYTLSTKPKLYCYIKLIKQGGDTFFEMKIPKKIDVSKGENIIFKMDNGDLVTLRTLDYASSTKGGGAVGLFYASAPGVHINGFMSEEQLDVFKSFNVTGLRVHSTKGYLETEIKEKKAIALVELANLLPKTIVEVETSPTDIVSTDYKPFAFRGLKWESSKDDIVNVMDSEPVTIVDGALGYKESIGGLDAILFYQMNNEKLNKVTYVFDEKHSEDNLYLADYTKVKSLLMEKYGSGSNETKWLNTLYADNEEDYGRAVAAGHLRIITKWELPDTTIHLALTGDNYEISHLLRYEKYPSEDITSKALGKL
jgi:hypothetical protein